MPRQDARIYKCPVCDTVVEVLEPCGLELVCCGPEMIPLTEKICNHGDPHALIIERQGDHLKVRVGDVPHHMDEEHHIVWIEVSVDGQQCCRQFLAPGQAPEASFRVHGKTAVVRTYCKVHGLWRAGEAAARSNRMRARETVAV